MMCSEFVLLRCVECFASHSYVHTGGARGTPPLPVAPVLTVSPARLLAWKDMMCTNRFRRRLMTGLMTTWTPSYGCSGENALLGAGALPSEFPSTAVDLAEFYADDKPFRISW